MKEIENTSDSETLLQQFVSFKINNESFCVAMDPVQEIIRVPEVVKVPMSPDTVLGLSNLRGKVLPIISLRKIFNIPEQPYDDLTRALVIKHNDKQIGFIVDRVSNVFSVEPSNIDSIEDFDSTINSELLSGIIRQNNDLIMVLNFDKIIEQQYNIVKNFDTDNQSIDIKKSEDDDIDENDDLQLVVFRLADEEFGIEVESVQEIVRVPDSLTKVPKTPDFVEGIVNLRGSVLPVINQRSQFSMETLERNDRQRIIVYVIGDLRTGFIVDSVAEVLTLNRNVIQEAPNISNDTSNIIKGIANLYEEKRLIMLIDSSKLLSDQQKIGLGELHV